MDPEDLEPRRPAPKLRELDTLSIAELKDYIVELEAEISRVKSKMAAKESHLLGAATLFRTDS